MTLGKARLLIRVRETAPLSEIKRHILLVDDDPGLLRLLSIRLEAEGFAVLAAESGEEALPALRNHAVDLVITDLRMGGMDGMY